jgi:2-haloacid dehalogenase
MKMNVKNIVFDFGGVLIDWNPRYLYEEVFSDKSEMEFFLENICSPQWNIK